MDLVAFEEVISNKRKLKRELFDILSVMRESKDFKRMIQNPGVSRTIFTEHYRCFSEDASWQHERNASANLRVFRKLALAILQR